MNPRDLEKADEIGKKAVSDDYIEDGGYIRDWLADDILAALSQARAEGRAEGVPLLRECKTWLDEDNIGEAYWTPAYKEFRQRLDTVLARLEAAEAVCQVCDDHEFNPCPGVSEGLKAWRKAAGK